MQMHNNTHFAVKKSSYSKPDPDIPGTTIQHNMSGKRLQDVVLKYRADWEQCVLKVGGTSQGGILGGAGTAQGEKDRCVLLC